MRLATIFLALVLAACSSRQPLIAPDGNTGMLLIPTNFTTDNRQTAFPYSYIFRYSGTQKGEYRIYPKIGSEYSLIGPLPVGNYNLDDYLTIGGSTGSTRAVTFEIEPDDIDVPFEIKADTITLFCCPFESKLTNYNATNRSFYQVEEFSARSENSNILLEHFQQLFSEDPNIAGWSFEAM